MSDELSLDPATVAAQLAELERPPDESDPWLVRRRLSFGASEVPALLIALGRVAPSAVTPKYVLKLAGKLFAAKAGLRRPDGAGRAAAVGADVEAEVVRAFNSDPWSGYPPIVPRARRHASGTR